MPTPTLHAPSLRRSLLSLAIGALPLAAHADMNADMNAGAAGMSTVVVTASGFEQTVREAPASITVLTREQLEKERFGNLAQALESVEGIDVAAAGDKTGGMNISIRGMPSDYTLILIDGRRQNAAGNVTPNGFGGTSTSFMPPVGAIERIEIIRGPMSTLYGSDAMGGVVNIITRKVGKNWTGTVSADYTVQEESAFGDVKAGKFYLSGPIASEVLGLALRGSAQRRDAASIRHENQTRNLSMGANPVESTVRNLGARLAFTPNRYHEVTLDADATRQKYDNTTGQLGTLGVQGGYGPEQKYNRDQYTLAYKARLPFGTWDSSYMVNQTETAGSREQGVRHQAAGPMGQSPDDRRRPALGRRDGRRRGAGSLLLHPEGAVPRRRMALHRQPGPDRRRPLRRPQRVRRPDQPARLPGVDGVAPLDLQGRRQQGL